MQIKDFIIDQNLKELTEHRTVALPMACYETTINQNINGYIPLHWHDEFQFVLIVIGEAIFHINEEKRVVREGEGLFITVQLTLIWKNLIINGFQLEYEQMEMLKSYRMKQMLNWIHTHYAEKILLNEIASAGQLSRSECCRYFKRILKKTPLNYVTDYRIQKSLVVLQQPESNVTDVAFQVGYNSTSYFIDQFKKSMNMTPLEYKKYKNA